MERIVHNLQQGTDEWNQFRLDHHGASEAAAMLGISKKTKRNELLRIKHTGIAKEFSDWVQKNILDHGHEVEEMARPIAEKIIGEELYPATYSYGRLSASCDGLTMLGDTAFEHKQWAADLAGSVRNGVLPEDHQPQCQQIMHVTGASRVMFMVSDGTDQNCVWMWVYPDSGWVSRIVAGWKQFDSDLANYAPQETTPVAVAAPISDLPALSIQIAGNVLASNLSEWRSVVTQRIEAINTDLQTDQDFADADSMTKFLADGEKNIGLVKKAAQAQAEPIDTLFRALDDISETMRQKRLELEKLVKARKDSIRNEILDEGQKSLAEHIAALNNRLARVMMPAVAADFAGAMKGKKTVESLRNAVSTTLANAKIAADEIAAKIETNLGVLDQHNDHAFLFSDLPTLVLKATDDLMNTIKIRISEHDAEQARRREAAEKIVAEQKPIEAVQPAHPAPEQAKQTVQPTMTPADAPDLAKDIIGMIASMDEAELKLVAHYCERVISQRKEAA